MYCGVPRERESNMSLPLQVPVVLAMEWYVLHSHPCGLKQKKIRVKYIMERAGTTHKHDKHTCFHTHNPTCVCVCHHEHPNPGSDNNTHDHDGGHPPC